MPGWLVFVLLVAGFAVGVGGTVAVMVAKQRRQRRLDISFRERNATKAVGEMPDVEDLIKSARFGDTDEEKARPAASSVPGPLHTGSKSCVSISIDGYSALLRSRQFSLSQAEEVLPVYASAMPEDERVGDEGGEGDEADAGCEIDVDRDVEVGDRDGGGDRDGDGEGNGDGEEGDDVDDDGVDDDDPDTPWIVNTSSSFAEATTRDTRTNRGEWGEADEGAGDAVATRASASVPRQKRRTTIGARVGPRGLDASATDILSNPDGREDKRASFDPPFERMARTSFAGTEVDVDIEAATQGMTKGGDRVEKEKVDMLNGSPTAKSPLRNNPFAAGLAEEDKDLIRASLY